MRNNQRGQSNGHAFNPKNVEVQRAGAPTNTPLPTKLSFDLQQDRKQFERSEIRRQQQCSIQIAPLLRSPHGLGFTHLTLTQQRNTGQRSEALHSRGDKR